MQLVGAFVSPSNCPMQTLKGSSNANMLWSWERLAVQSPIILNATLFSAFLTLVLTSQLLCCYDKLVFGWWSTRKWYPSTFHELIHLFNPQQTCKIFASHLADAIRWNSRQGLFTGMLYKSFFFCKQVGSWQYHKSLALSIKLFPLNQFGLLLISSLRQNAVMNRLPRKACSG